VPREFAPIGQDISNPAENKNLIALYGHGIDKYNQRSEAEVKRGVERSGGSTPRSVAHRVGGC